MTTAPARPRLDLGDLDPASPAPESLLVRLHDVPAVADPDPADLVTESARILRPAAGTSAVDAMVTADDGTLLLPPGVAPSAEREGRTAARGTLAALLEDGDYAASEVSGHIPDTEPIVLHPPVVAARGDGLPTLGSPSAADEDVTIFGTDDRFNVYPNGYPLRCVCRIEVYIRQYANGPWVYEKRGTGFLVGSRHMISSGHMHPSNTQFGWMIKVVPGSYDNVSVYGSGFVTYVSDFHWWNSDAGSDMMICRLFDAVGNTAGWFGAATYDSSWEDQSIWTMVGYPFDRGEWRPTMQVLIPVRDDDDGTDIRLPNGVSVDTTQVENEADRARGASGSPLYRFFGDGQCKAIGVHHGLEVDWIFPAGSERFSAAAGGPGLPTVINWARSVWP